MLLFPQKRLHRVTELRPTELRQQGIRGLILDIDNTLTTHDNPVPSPGVSQWLAELRQAGIALIVLSNNHGPRVEPFAKLLGLDYISEGKKPLPGGYARCAKALGLPKEALCAVGDQLFTDILGANLYGCASVLVEPIQLETTAFFRFKRFWERLLLHFYREDVN